MNEMYDTDGLKAVEVAGAADGLVTPFAIGGRSSRERLEPTSLLEGASLTWGISQDFLTCLRSLKLEGL